MSKHHTKRKPTSKLYTIHDLPNDLLWHIFSKADYCDITKLCQASKALSSRLCNSPEFWLRRLSSEYKLTSREIQEMRVPSDYPSEDYLTLLLKLWLKANARGYSPHRMTLDNKVEVLAEILVQSRNTDHTALLLLRYLLRDEPDMAERIITTYANFTNDTRMLEYAILQFVTSNRHLLPGLAGTIANSDIDAMNLLYAYLLSHSEDDVDPITQKELQVFLLEQLATTLEGHEDEGSNWIYNRLIAMGNTRRAIRKALPAELDEALDIVVQRD